MPLPNIITTAIASIDLSLYSQPYAWLGDWYNSPQRRIEPDGKSPIGAQVVVTEEHSDDLTITDHPIEGPSAVISDHAVKRPSEVQIQMGWSNAFLAAHPEMGSDITAVYEQILELQASRLPFTVYTGKRVYYNMLVASLRTHTDASLEYTFMADISFREVVLVNTQIVAGTGASYNTGALSLPQVNTATLPSGQVQLQNAVVDDGTFNDIVANNPLMG